MESSLVQNTYSSFHNKFFESVGPQLFFDVQKNSVVFSGALTLYLSPWLWPLLQKRLNSFYHLIQKGKEKHSKSLHKCIKLHHHYHLPASSFRARYMRANRTVLWIKLHYQVLQGCFSSPVPEQLLPEQSTYLQAGSSRNIFPIGFRSQAVENQS